MVVIGIDLGTSNSCVAYYKDGVIDIVSDEAGNRTTPSAVAFCDGEIEVGKFAFDKFVKNSKNVIFGIKYIIGRKYIEKTVEEKKSSWPFAIINHEDKIKIMVTIKGENKYYLPEEISGILLKHLKLNAEKQLNSVFDNVVITVPTYFNDAQRRATMDAGKIAGFKNIKLLNEAIAAAIAYGNEHEIYDGLSVLVFDLGGGTFDVSILKYNKQYKVLSIDGNLHKGGDDVDNKLVEYVCKYLFNYYGIIAKDRRTIYRLKRICERAKQNLTDQLSTDIEIFTVFRDTDAIKLSRNEFNEINRNIFSDCMQTVENCMQKILLDPKEIDSILLVGGSSRIPKIQENIREYFGKEPKKSVNADEAVAIGAAIYSASWQKEAFNNLHVSVISAYSLGIELDDKSFHKLIPKFKELPAKASEDCVVSKNSTSSAIIRVFSGENDIANENELLGTLELDGLINDDKFIVTFNVTENGILYVTTVDKNGKLEKIDIQLDRGALSITEIDDFSKKIQEEFNRSDQIKSEKNIKV